MTTKTISIGGLGWLGNFIANHFKEKGYSIKATTTTPSKLPEFESEGYKGFLFNIDSDEPMNEDFIISPIHILCIPPSKIKGDYSHAIKKYVEQLDPETILFFISSTSVYPEISGNYLEKDESGHGKMLQAEKAIASKIKKHFILRCSGLIGPNRDPGNFLAGRTALKGPFSSVNLIHAMDICTVIEKLIPSKIHGIYNVSVTAPLNKKEFYTKASRKISNAPPQFDMKSESHKRIIDTKKVELLTKVDFRFTKAYFNLLG